MSLHRYSVTSLLSDGFKAAFGFSVTVGPLLFLDVVWPLALILGAGGLVFLVFALRTAEHGLSSIELSNHEISRHGPLASRLVWRDLKGLKLARYAAPRHSSDGWYQLVLAGETGKFKVESTIDGFDIIVAAAVKAAKACELGLDPATGDNLQSLGFDIARATVDHYPPGVRKS
ncbi:MAG: hypothetical protein ACR2QJ_15645 [Geminicoccaceae bacterium]